MFKFAIRLIGLAMVMNWSTINSASADEPTWFGQNADGKWMAGLRYGRADNNTRGFRDADALGIVLGYQFARPVGYDGSSSIEFEVTSSDEGDIVLDNDLLIGPGEWDADMMGLFFAYRTPGTVYFKGKLGGYRTEIHNKGIKGTNSRFRTSNTSLGYGAGLGLRLQADINFNLELEFTAGTDDADVDLITLGGIWLF